MPSSSKIINGTHGITPVGKSWVKVDHKSETGFSLDGKEFALVGPNIYWLGLVRRRVVRADRQDENNEQGGKQVAFPTRGRVNEAMAMVRERKRLH